MLNERNTLLEDDGIEEEILVEEECSVAQAVWGDIQGNIENQTDLQNALDAKQDSLTEAQLNAVNSGITSEKVTTYDGYADQIASKADQSALNAESTARGEADTALGTRIDNEVLARQQADNGLQSQIDAITSKSDVVDVVANYAALQAYDTSTLGNNDVVKVLDDETHEDALTYYRWSTTTQTWSYIGQEAPYYSKGQMDVKLAEKQDKLTAGANIQIQNGTISATDTKYTNGNGLNLNGTEFSADTDVLATKEDLEGYYTKPETDNLLAPKLEAEVVAELPTTGAEGKLYLTPKAHTTQTATGNPIEATITDEAGQIESFQLDGDTFQQSYTGKNLFNKNNYPVIPAFFSQGTPTITASGINRMTYIPCSPNTTYTVQKTASSVFSVGYTTELPAVGVTTYNVKDAYRGGVNTITTGADAAYLVVRFLNTADDTVTQEEMASSIQIETGSATSYEPYVGGQPSPNPEYPQPIQTVTGEQTVEVVGKNLFDIDSIITGYELISATGEVRQNADWWVTPLIPVKAGAVYTSSNMRVLNKVFYAADGSFISTITTQTATAPADARYMRMNAKLTDIPNYTGKAQLELGSSDTTYAPYFKQTLPLDLGSIELCNIGTYQDYIWKDGEDWKVHKATETKVLNGSDSEDWAAFTYGGYTYELQTALPAPNSPSKLLVLSGYFFGIPYDNRTQNIPNSIYLSGTGRKINIRNTAWTTVEQFKTWLASNNTTVYYALETPTDTTITDTTLIAQLEAIRTASLENGTNTITNTATGTNLAGDMEIGYFGFNPTNRYDKFIWLNLNNNYEQIGGE